MKKVFTLFCLCALCVSSAKADYVLVESALSDWRGDYLIAYNDETFMDGSQPGGKNGVGGASTYVNPEENLSSDGFRVNESWGDLHYVTIEAINDDDLSAGYVIKSHSDTNPYFYQTNNANGMAATSNKGTAASYPITVNFVSSSNIQLCLGGSASGAILQYNPTNTGKMFRYYKNGTQAAIYLYKKETTKSFDVAITSAGYATAYVPFAATVTGATAYYVTVEGSSAKLHEIEGTIPANTGIVLKGAAGTAKFTESKDAPATVTGNVLKGTLEAKTQAELGETEIKLIYVLNEVDGKVGFYHLDGTLAANRAYMEVAVGVDVKAFFFDEEATGIQNSQFTIHNSDVMYNLNGQVVGKDYKGIVIVNGKKMLNK